MRLLKDAAAEIKSLDPGTAVTPYYIRQLAIEGKVKSIMAGRKRLINFDDLLDYLGNYHVEPEIGGKIRRIG
jgi:excisionase family DNA binding protein